MANAYHASIEGAQHGAISLARFLDYAKAAGALRSSDNCPASIWYQRCRSTQPQGVYQPEMSESLPPPEVWNDFWERATAHLIGAYNPAIVRNPRILSDLCLSGMAPHEPEVEGILGRGLRFPSCLPRSAPKIRKRRCWVRFPRDFQLVVPQNSISDTQWSSTLENVQQILRLCPSSVIESMVYPLGAMCAPT